MKINVRGLLSNKFDSDSRLSLQKLFDIVANAVNYMLLRVQSTGIGYTSGDGGTVTQQTSKSTGVTLHKPCGEIVMHNASLADSSSVTFILTNSTISPTDVVNTSIGNTATTSIGYIVTTQPDSGFCYFRVKNDTGGAQTEAVAINFSVSKAVHN